MLSNTLRQAHISYIGFITNVIFKRKPSDKAFLHTAALFDAKRYINVIKTNVFLTTHRQVKRDIVLSTLLVSYTNLSYKSTIYECVHRLILERAYAKHRATIITIDSNVIKSSVM